MVAPRDPEEGVGLSDPTIWGRTGRSYDAVAEKYEARFLDELRDKRRDRELLDSFAGSVMDPVVELGCGPGHIGAFVRARGRTVMGLDLSVVMAGRAHARLDAAVAGDLRALPFADRRVGGLLAFYSLIHLRRSELGAALVELRRVLRPGGRVLVSAHEGRGHVELDELLDEPVPVAATFFELDELVRAMTAAGLAVLSAERREPYPSKTPTVRLYVEGERPTS